MKRNLLFGMVALLAVAMSACGPGEDDGRVALPLHVVVDSASAADVVLSVDYEVVVRELEFTMSSGTVISGTSVRDGETFVVEDQIFVLPGDEVLIHLSFEIDGQPYAPSTTLIQVTEATTGFEIRLTHREDLENWVLGVGPLTGPVE